MVTTGRRPTGLTELEVEEALAKRPKDLPLVDALVSIVKMNGKIILA
jgi:hypothetical protein